MARKRDMVYSEFYAPHLNGGRMAHNPALSQQALTEQMYFGLLVELCANRFEWLGFPDSIDTRFLEMNLVYRALTVIYRDEDSGELLAVQGSGAGHTNFNDNPVRFTVIGAGPGAGSAKTLSAVNTRDADETQVLAECVPVWANYRRTPDLNLISLYAHKLAKLDRSIEITGDNMRKTKVLSAPENSRLSYVNILKQIADGQDVVFGTDALDMSAGVQVLDLGVDPLTLPNLMIARSKLWNECMGLLGINNANQDKKERLVAAEVGANDEQVQATRNIALNARQTAAAQISKRYGLTVTVDFKQPPPPPADAPGEEFQSGGSGSKTESEAA